MLRILHDASAMTASRIDPSIDFEVLGRFEQALELREKISCMFLILDNYRTGYDAIVRASHDENHMISILIRNENVTNWAHKMVEALSITQNCDILLNLGSDPMKVRTCYLSHIVRTPAVALNKYAKVLYSLFESLSTKDVWKILRRVYPKFVPPFEFKHGLFLEVHFLWWIKHEWITISPEGRWKLEKFLRILTELSLDSTGAYDILSSWDRLDTVDVSGDGDVKNRIETARVVIDQPMNRTKLDSYIIDNGFVIIVNQQKFPPNSKWPDRAGSECDRDRIAAMFEDTFGFQCERHENLTKDSLYDLLDNFDNHPARNFDCVMLFLLSHGNLGNVISSDEMNCPINEITEKFCSGAFIGKPKMLVIQACQSYDSSNTVSPEFPKEDGDEYERQCDILILMSTIPGKESIRDSERGTWYINTLCNVLEKMAQSGSCDMYDCVTLLNEECSELRGRIKQRLVSQVSEATSRLRKKFVLCAKKRPK